MKLWRRYREYRRWAREEAREWRRYRAWRLDGGGYLSGGRPPDQFPPPSTGVKRPPPPFDPDPELIDHLEGNKRERDRYRDEVRRMRDECPDQQV